MKNYFNLRKVLLVTVLFTASKNALAVWWFIPWLVGIGKAVVVKTVVITKISTVILTKQSVAISGLAKIGAITGKTILIGGKVLPVVAVGALVIDYGLEPSGSKSVDEMFITEIAAAKVAGLNEYHAKICKKQDEYYGVPTDTVMCLNGLEPELLDKPIDLNQLETPKIKN